MSALGMLGIDDDTLDPVHGFRRRGLAACDGLWHLAPAAIQQGGGGGDPRRRGGILVPHDVGQGLDRDAGMAARQRAYFGESIWHMG